jgi:hypothetical protein
MIKNGDSIMRKFFAFAVALLTGAVMTACSVPGKKDGTSPNGLSSSFKAEVSIKLDEMDSEGTINRYGDGMWDIEFSSPNTISGVTLSFADGNAKATYKGLTFSVPQTALPVKSMMTNLIDATDELSQKEKLEGKKTDDGMEVCGKLDGGDYVLTVDKSGNILKFEMPGSKLVMEFKDVAPISSSEMPQTTTTQNGETQTTTTVSDSAETAAAVTSAVTDIQQ